MAADKMPLEGDNSYGFKRGIGIDYFGGAPGITTIRFDGDLTLSDFKIRLEGGDLVFYLIDPANPNQPLNEIADVFYFDNWIAGDHGIERFEFADGTVFSNLTVSSSGYVKYYGTDGNDIFNGTSAGEEIYGSAGADIIDGGGGNNVIRYSNSTEGVSVNLDTGAMSGGDAEGDQLSNIKTVFGSNHDDVIIGDDSNNGLYALDGDDHLEGGAGDDWLNAYGSGDNYLDGGTGNDTVRYRWSKSAVTVNLVDQTKNEGDADGDTLVSIENVMGSNSYDDHITGDADNNKLWGYGGDDTLDGGDGNDTLLGGKGNDILKAGNGIDILEGGAGDDEFHYGEGTTTFRYDLGDGNDTIHVNHDIESSYNEKVVFGPGIPPADVTVTRQGEGTDKYGNERDDLDFLLTFKDGGTLRLHNVFHHGPNYFTFGQFHFADGTVWNWESFNKMRFENAGEEDEELAGTLGDDTIDGRGGDDDINGYSGDDHLVGGDGNDTLRGHEGNDHLEGGAGDDRLESTAGNNVLDGGAGNDTILSITYGEDQILGGSGNDTIHAATGTSVISGGTGDDIVNVSSAKVTVRYDLGDGNDTVDFWYPEKLKEENHKVILGSGISPDEVTVTHANGTSTDLLLTFKDGGTLKLKSVIDSDTLRLNFGEIEFADGTVWNWEVISEKLADSTGEDETVTRLTFPDSVDNFSTNALNDHIIHAGGGDDHITTSAGDDSLYGQAGNDTLKGRTGNDLLDGGDGDDTLIGGAGNDILKAGNGNDTLEGGTGDDEFYYGNGITTFRYDLGDGNDTIYVNHSEDATINNEKVVFGAAISPNEITVTQVGEGIDRQGYLRDDLDLLLTFKDGGTLLIKNAFYIYPTAYTFSEFHFADGTVWNWEDINRFCFENASGDDDVLAGTLGDDVIYGFGGDDRIEGLLGNDHLIGGEGNDTLKDNDGDNHLEGGAGNDRLTAVQGNNILDGGEGDDTINSGTEGENQVIGGDGNDTIHAYHGTSIVAGGAGDDTTWVYRDTAIITGGADNDTTYVTRGAEVTIHYNLGDGDDLVEFWEPEDFKDKNNKIILGPDVLPDEVTVARTSSNPNNIILTFKDGGTLLLSGVMDPHSLRFILGEIEFADGTMWTWENINQKLLENVSDGDDLLGGTTGDDVIRGLGGNDTIYGEDGDDHLIGGEGNDILKGGDGDDLLEAGFGGDDILDGGNGNDTLHAGTPHAIQLLGGSGNDTLYVFHGASHIEGGKDDDILHYYGGDITVHYGLGDGHDIIHANGKAGRPSNKLIFNAAITPDEVLVSGSLEFTFADGGTLRLDDGFFPSGKKMLFNEVHFSDGTVWTWEDINQKLIDSAAAHAFDHGARAGNDTITGTVDGDIIKSLAGDDVVDGGNGRDFIFGGDGNDTIKGGDGSDVLSGDAGNDHIYGEAGDDKLHGGDGDDQMFGGDGNDELYGGNGNDHLYGGDGDDLLGGGTGDNILEGGNGDDVMSGSTLGNNTLLGGNGNDSFYSLATPTSDVITTIEGGSGNDTLHYSGGEVVLHYGLGDGKDIIHTKHLWTAESKIVFGEGITPDDVSIERSAGNSSSSDLQYHFKDGGSLLIVDAFSSTVGRLAFGEIQFADGTVWNWEDIHEKLLKNASDNADILWGTNGDDVINGFGGDDVIVAVNGDNQISGGAGDDTITCGDRRDTIIFGESFGNDTIIDFHANQGFIDTIQFSDGVFETFEDVMSAAREEGSDTIIQLDENNSITLQFVEVSDLHADDFSFVS
ncbi:calcium-binding protein [Pseudovibrio sp. Ad37]|uniref:calcium-binding protein n=1 Tax=Pseudovibrio sp. Ad37 TaxID=989422 RepID=UPI0007AE9F09|nr:calcium-binding protein [Pseudovibrio sp. Ad37]KZL27178.1 Bifunctional hemolysin/adenylate cyclase precursor [Pseudovibrio sp. Ad37]